MMYPRNERERQTWTVEALSNSNITKALYKESFTS
jgi:hypothetical protein